MNDVYLTSTFTNEWNVKFNPILGQALQTAGLACSLPEKIKDNQVPSEIFTRDIDNLKNSKCILAVAKNESPNWGAELGFVYALKKPIIALTDVGHTIPLICSGMITEKLEVDNLDDIDTYLPKLLALIKEFQ